MTEIRKEALSLVGASLPFWHYRAGEDAIIEFDSCGCACPVPMLNAIVGLERIAASGEKLIMINGFEPQGLYDRIRGFFTWQVEPLAAGRVKVVFTALEGAAERFDFSNRACQGG